MNSINNPLSTVAGVCRLVADSAKKAAEKVDFNLVSGSARIAIVGASRSGKTVLLTSLIDHLCNHDPRRFRLKPSPLSGKQTARILKYQTLGVPAGMTPFPFAAFRQALIEDARWPSKTKDTYQYRMKVYRDDSVIARIKNSSSSSYYSFLDFPGERIADAPMTGSPYADWSDAMLNGLPSGKEFDPLVAAFRRATENPESTESVILSAYKAILAERLRQFHTAISPSTFVLCPSGTIPERSMPANRLISSRYTGLSATMEFCPLPMGTRESRPDLASRFHQAYEAYRNKLIFPLFSALKESDRLCILVNIPEILQSGVGAYNDHVDLLRQVVAFCSPQQGAYRSILQSIYKTVGKVLIDDKYRPGGIDKVAFVATQADRVRVEDMSRLAGLARELHIHSTRSLPGVQMRMEAFACVAVQATNDVGKGHLQGRLMSRPARPSDAVPKVEEYRVSSLPNEWPPNWNPEEFVFPDVWPKFNQNRNIPPEQTGLDRLFNYLIS